MFGIKKNKKKVFVGLSGGVDSSVTAALLVRQGFDVTGVYIKGWYPEWKECSWKENRRDAMRICAQLNIPFQTLDLSESYKKDVVDYFLTEYKKGRTPNPDVMCNKHIKFGGFYDWAMQNGAEYIATGHYARIQDESLLRGVDESKDQSYFLWTIKKEQLPQILFPLGTLRKRKVRSLARTYNLTTAEKKDSQGICFLEDISMEEFLRHYFKAEKGPVLNNKGKIIGEHDGALLYTIGQRQGFITNKKTTQEKPYFVVSKNIEDNTITVSTKKPVSVQTNSHNLGVTNWLETPQENVEYEAQSRYRQMPSYCFISKKNGVWSISFKANVEQPTPGQSMVVYKNERLIGGGVID